MTKHETQKMPSPNYDDRSSAINLLILHYTGMKTGAEAIARLCNAESKVSAHYVVEEDGGVFALVAEEKRAWHAGKSYWRGKQGLNDCSIGIEIVNLGHEFGYRAFPLVQMEAVAKLCQEILTRHNIPARNVIAHSDIAPNRKEDPGELFDWAMLANVGVGLYPPANLPPLPVSDFKKALGEYGYDTSAEKLVLAFQRHFTPHALTGEWNGECEAALQWLLGHC